MKNIFLTCCLLVSIFVFQSCDGVYTYTYEINNQSFTPIKVESELFFGGTIDTLIEVGESIILLETTHGVEGGNGPHWSPISGEFTSIKISKFDTLYAERDFLDDDEWMYNEGNYSITVVNEDFF